MRKKQIVVKLIPMDGVERLQELIDNNPDYYISVTGSYDDIQIHPMYGDQTFAARFVVFSSDLEKPADFIYWKP